MKIISSYAVEIKHINKLFRQTIKIYNDAITFCVKIFEENWSDLKILEVGNKERKGYAEKLIHSTKSNVAKLFTPDENQNKDAWQFDYRLYHDSFVLDNKVQGIYVHTK